MPVHDRPMIYFPLQTLAGMGIDRVMVILGGRSVGDIVELLSGGRDFGLGPSRPPAAPGASPRPWGPTQALVGEEPFCVVLGDNILRGDPLAEVAEEFAS